MICTEIRVQPENETTVLELSAEEKRDYILKDPRFGMCSLTRYMLKHPKNKNCAQFFARQLCLPLIVFFAQWLMFISILLHKYDLKECGGGAPAQKMLMISVAMVYFVHSFFAYDNIKQSYPHHKVTPSSSIVVSLDTFQEHSFNLFVQIANLWLVYISDDLLDALFNSLALEFLMNLDNEYERMYFENNIEEAEDIYDNYMVTPAEDCALTKERRKYILYRFYEQITYVPFKLLSVGFTFLPVYCFLMICVGGLCK